MSINKVFLNPGLTLVLCWAGMGPVPPRHAETVASNVWKTWPVLAGMQSQLITSIQDIECAGLFNDAKL